MVKAGEMKTLGFRAVLKIGKGKGTVKRRGEKSDREKNRVEEIEIEKNVFEVIERQREH